MTTDSRKAREFFVTVDGREYCIEVRPGESGKIFGLDPGNDGRDYWWIDVKELQPDLKWWKTIFSESATDCDDWADALRSAFKRQRGRMRGWLESWIMYRQCAAEERGGKRGYYTRHKNESLKYALDYAPRWKLAKALWKEITRL